MTTVKAMCGSGTRGGGDGGGGTNGGVGGAGGEGGGGEHESLVHTAHELPPQPVSQHLPPCSSLAEHNRPPCAAHSSTASCSVATPPSATTVGCNCAGHTDPRQELSADPSGLQQRIPPVVEARAHWVEGE